MYGQHITPGTKEHVKLLRKRAGRYVKELRTQAGLTQKELARLVGWEYESMVSGIEIGAHRIPPDKVEIFARALKVDLRDFARHMLMYSDPFMYKCLFGLPTREDMKDLMP